MTARVLCLATLLLACACGQAQAATLKAFGTADDPPLSDGDRWAVIPVAGGMFVLDGRDHVPEPEPVALTAPCGPRPGAPRGVGGGLVLVECPSVLGELRQRLLVYDLAARTFTEAEGTELIVGAEGHGVTGIGRSWISFNRNLEPRGGNVPGLLDWRAGRVIRQSTRTRTAAVDLDLPAGSRRVCAALRNRALRLVPLSYRPPFGISRRGTLGRRRLVLERCKGRSITLSKPGKVRAVSFGERVVAWAQGAAIQARVLRSGRQKRWRVPRGKAVLGLAQAGPHLLVTMRGGTVYRGRTP